MLKKKRASPRVHILNFSPCLARFILTYCYVDKCYSKQIFNMSDTGFRKTGVFIAKVKHVLYLFSRVSIVEFEQVNVCWLIYSSWNLSLKLIQILVTLKKMISNWKIMQPFREVPPAGQVAIPTYLRKAISQEQYEYTVLPPTSFAKSIK